MFNKPFQLVLEGCAIEFTVRPAQHPAAHWRITTLFANLDAVGDESSNVAEAALGHDENIGFDGFLHAPYRVRVKKYFRPGDIY
jgi:hypothetical protein